MPSIVSGSEIGSFLLCLILKSDLARSLILFPHWVLNQESRETKIFKVIAFLQRLRL